MRSIVEAYSASVSEIEAHASPHLINNPNSVAIGGSLSGCLAFQKVRYKSPLENGAPRLCSYAMLA